MSKNAIAESLYNCDEESFSWADGIKRAYHIEYGRGVLVGVVGCYMGALDLAFEDALAQLGALYRHTIYRGCVPDSWIDEVEKYFTVVPHYR